MAPEGAGGGPLKPFHALALLAFALAGCDGSEHHKSWPGRVGAAQQSPGEKIEVPPPPFTEGAFPCTECHDPEIPVNKTRRTLEMSHQEIELKHDEEHRWCLDCHSSTNRDKLQLASGEQIDFTESYRLCGQCHGDKYRDWRVGVHGRRSGEWNGHKSYLLCVHCHYSHAPAFKPLKPMPPPVRPSQLAKGGKS
ncbi:MAG: hypothetical protein JNN13_02680 [Planctomycetes bacterium]|nr:hypothetical protein [Planctomycetota bacterium]